MLRKPAWADKLEINSHHFQAADAYHEQGVARAASRLRDDAWGIDEIEWDVGAMAQGKLEIRRLELTLKDGTEIYVGTGDRPLTLPMPDLGKRKSIRIYVGVPAIRPSRSNADPAGDPRSFSRYSVEEHTIPDEANGTEPVDAKWLRPNAWLLSEDNRLNGFDVVQCARLVQGEQGRPALDSTFVPPIWRVRASPHLMNELEELLKLLQSRKAWADHWESLEVLKHRRAHLRGLLGSFIKIVLDILDRPQKSPEDTYSKLVEMIGALAPFTPEGDAPLPAVENGAGDDGLVALPPYRHDDLGPVFAATFAALRKVLSAIGAEDHEQIRLTSVQGYPWALQGDLRKPGLFDKDFFIAVTGQDLDGLREQVHHLKIAPLHDLLEGKYAAIPGVPLRWRQRPLRLPEVRGTLYFQLDDQSDVWKAISRALWIGIQCNQVPGLASLSLYAVDRDAR